MQIKKFEAPTIQEALDTIKRELGPEAIILQTKKNKRGFGLLSKESVEITAAISDRSLHKKKVVESHVSEPNREAIKKMPAERQVQYYDQVAEKYLEKANTTRERVELSRPKGTPSKVTQPTATSNSVPRGGATRYIDIQDSKEIPMNSLPVHEELKHLKRMVEELKSSQDERLEKLDRLEKASHVRADHQERGLEFAGATALLEKSLITRPEFQEVFEQLVINGVDKRLAYSLVKKAVFEVGDDPSVTADRVLDQIAHEIIQTTEVHSPLSSIGSRKLGGGAPTVLAMVGPTGVGKTTTIAKIASEAILRRNLKVGLINLDSYKVAAFDQLGTYAKILNVPFRSVASVEDLKVALQDFQGMDLILVDTTGRSPKDPDSLKEMQEILRAIPGVRCQLVVAATTRDSELYDITSRFSIFRPQGIVVSKLDEATLYGSVYNVVQKSKLPLLYFTTGQRVPEDIEEATPERVASLLLDL